MSGWPARSPASHALALLPFPLKTAATLARIRRMLYMSPQSDPGASPWRHPTYPPENRLTDDGHRPKAHPFSLPTPLAHARVAGTLGHRMRSSSFRHDGMASPPDLNTSIFKSLTATASSTRRPARPACPARLTHGHPSLRQGRKPCPSTEPTMWSNHINSKKIKYIFQQIK